MKKQFEKKTPIEDRILRNISKESFIFDLVYMPQKTKLFYQCKKYQLKYKNGLEMNTFQGQKALDIVNKLTNFKLN